MTDQMVSLLERLDEVERRFEGLESRFEKYGGDINTRVNGYQQHLDQLVAWVEEIKLWAVNSIDVCLNRVAALESQMQGLEASTHSQNGASPLPSEVASLTGEGIEAEAPTEGVSEGEAAGLAALREELLERLEALERRIGGETAREPIEEPPAAPSPSESALIPVELSAEPLLEESTAEAVDTVSEGAERTEPFSPMEEEAEAADHAALEPGGGSLLPVEAPPSMLDVSVLTEEALAREEAERVEDVHALEASRAELEHWGEMCRRLQEGIAAAQERAGAILAASAEAKEALPAPIQERLEGRQRGLELIGKMLARLLEKPTLDVPESAPPELPVVSQEEWMALLASETEEATARKRIEAQLRRVGTERFRAVAEYRALTEGTRRRFKDFLTRQAFPVLDGVNDGERHSAELQTQFLEEDVTIQEALSRWMQSYPDLRALLHETLAQVSVIPMAVQTGEEVDYERHEPFDTEPDENLPNEHVKSLVRNGYEYRNADETLLLRPAQVIVVKN